MKIFQKNKLLTTAVLITILIFTGAAADAYSSLNDAITAGDSNNRSYTMSQDEAVSSNLGVLNAVSADDTATLTVIGNSVNKIIASSGVTGLTVPNLRTMIINNVAGISNFGAANSNGSFANIAEGGTLNATNTIFTNNGNYHQSEGVLGGSAYGGVLVNAGSVTLTNGSFKENCVKNTEYIGNTSGGAIYNTGTLNIGGTGFYDNLSYSQTSKAGAIYNSSTGTAIINNATFTENTVDGPVANGGGGAIYNTGSLTITNSSFTNNKYIYTLNNSAVSAQATVGSTVTFTDKDEISVSITVTDITGSTLSGESLTHPIPNEAKITSVVIGGTTIDLSNEYGGGVTTYLSNNGNIAYGDGGAIYNDTATGSLHASTTTFKGNTSKSKGDYGGNGGAIYNVNGGSVVIDTNSSFQENESHYGGAIYNSASSFLTLGKAPVKKNEAGAKKTFVEKGPKYYDSDVRVFGQNSTGAKNAKLDEMKKSLGVPELKNARINLSVLNKTK